MSVYMSLRVKADADRLAKAAAENQEMLQAIAARARDKGCIHHRFARQDGDVLVIDEWDSEDSFWSFFKADPDVPKLMQAAGAEGEPQVMFFEPLSLGDEF
jgi:heme-degrading monooxygenase HmoA